MSYIACKYCNDKREPGLMVCRRHMKRIEAKRATFRPPDWVRPKYERKKDPFYLSKEWMRLRAWALATWPTCLSCKRAQSVDVDHILPRKRRPDLELSEANLQPLCHSCHSKKSNAERSGWAYDFRRGVKRRYAKGERWEL